ncbi:hypothetical protein Gogos_011755, partial [Gossypium gossypioides]|nr:hypothetical protein [Gossypium gossypioides]
MEDVIKYLPQVQAGLCGKMDLAKKLESSFL